MDIKLKKGTQYAIQALEWLVEKPDRTPVDVGEMARTLSASPTYLAKIFHHLVRDGILISRRGRMGGFSLHKRPAEIRLADIVMACENFERQRICMLDGKRCVGRKHPCQIHPIWLRIQTEIRGLFEKTTLADLMKNGVHAS